jgi:hypothetical protein
MSKRGAAMLFRCLAAIALAGIATQAMAREPLQLAPSSKWDIDYGAERCSLMREFGAGNEAVHLQIDSFGYWNQFRVILAGTAIPRLNGPSGVVNVRRNGDPAATHADSLQGTSGKVPAVSFNLSFVPYVSEADFRKLSDGEQANLALEYSRPQPEYDATVDTLSVGPGPGRELVLHVGNMGAPLVAMRACVGDMIKTWGQDPEVQRTLSRAAKPLPRTVKKVQADYPPSMMYDGINAYVPVRLTVDASGDATNCVIQAETVDKAFKQAVCEHLAGKFEPALDKDGHPVTSIYSTAVIYRIR